MPLRLPPVPRFSCAPVRSGVRFLGTAAAAPIRKRTHRLRKLGVVVGLGTLGFLADRTFNAEALARTARTGFYGYAHRRIGPAIPLRRQMRISAD